MKVDVAAQIKGGKGDKDHIDQAIHHKKVKSAVYAAIVAFILVGLLALAMHFNGLSSYTWLPQDGSRKFVFFAYCAASFMCVTAFLFFILTTVPRFLSLGVVSNTTNETSKWYDFAFRKQDIVGGAIVIFLCWIPWIVVQYPCSIAADTFGQLIQFFTPAPTFYTTGNIFIDAKYIDHHPVFDTWVFGVFVAIGKVVGNQNLGLFFYSVLQCAGTATVLSFSCCYLEKIEAPRVVRRALLLFMSVFPIVPLYATCMCKDSLSCIFFVLFCVICVEIVRTKGKALANRKWLIAYILTACLCILTKKTGLYLVVLTMLLFLVVYRSSWKRLLLSLSIPLIACILILPLFYPLVGGVAPGGKQEALGVSFQQTVKVIMVHKDEISEEELASVSAVLDLDAAIDAFSEDGVDGVKNKYRQDSTTSDLLEYVKTYVNLGLRYPLDYLKAIYMIDRNLLSPAYGFGYYPKIQGVISDSFKARFIGWEGDPGFDFAKPDNLQELNLSLNKVLLSLPQKIPFLGWFFSKGFFSGWLILFAFAVILRVEKRWAFMLLPVAVSFLFLFLSPVASARYALPFLYVTPLVIGVTCGALRASVKKETPRLP